MDNGSSVLLAIDGLLVDRVWIDETNNRRTVLVRTDPALAGWCPSCREQSTSLKGWSTTSPRDLPCGPDAPKLLWLKQKWRCRTTWCERVTFTDSVPEVPPRKRITCRLRQRAGRSVGDHSRAVSSVAAEYGLSWATTHDAFIAHADAAAPASSLPAVTVLGLDETRRGKGHYETDPDTGARKWVDRFDTGLVDISGPGGLFAQVNGRTSQVVIDWLEQQDPVWRAAITHVSMDTSATYARAAREALPHAAIIVDRFHLVALANRAVTDYRRELTWARRGRRGRKTDPEWAQRNRLLRAGDHLTEEEAAKLHTAMTTADRTGGLEKCWQAKELLRNLLALAGTRPDRTQIDDRLTRFYQHCADADIHQLRTLAWTINAWQTSIIEGLHTGISNGRTEGYNRIVKHIGRIGFGFRNQTNHKRRIRFACTQASRRSAQPAAAPSTA